MRFLILAALFASSCPVSAQTGTQKRLTNVEKRVTKVEKRVAKLEGAPARAAATVKKEKPANPVTVTFVGKKQEAGPTKMVMKLYMEFENVSASRLFAFSGTLVFRDQGGAVIWSRPYAHSEPLGAGEKVDVSMGILSTHAREYLKFIKASAVTVSLENQEAYAAQ